MIEVDELRSQAFHLAEESGPRSKATEAQRDRAATLAAVQLAQPILESGNRVVLLDYLGSRFGATYRKVLSRTASVHIVRLDTDGATHRARNSSRPARRHYPSATLDLLRASARREGHPDLVIDTTGNSPEQTAHRLERVLQG
jgi:predicted kinase